jgi:hypothetical protein
MSSKTKFFKRNWVRVTTLAIITILGVTAISLTVFAYNGLLPKLILKRALTKLTNQKAYKYSVDLPAQNINGEFTVDNNKGALNQAIINLKQINNNKKDNVKLFVRYNQDNIYVSFLYSLINEFDSRIALIDPGLKQTDDFKFIKNLLSNRTWFSINIKKIFAEFDKMTKYKKPGISESQTKELSEKVANVFKVNRFQPFFVNGNRLYTRMVLGFDKNNLKEFFNELDRLSGTAGSYSSLKMTDLIDKVDTWDKDYITVIIDMKGQFKGITLDKIDDAKNELKDAGPDMSYSFITKQLFSARNEKNNEPFLTVDFDFDSKNKIKKPESTVDYMEYVSTTNTNQQILLPVLVSLFYKTALPSTQAPYPTAQITSAFREIYQRKTTGKTPAISSGQSVDRELYMIHNMLSRYYMEKGSYPGTLEPLANNYFPGALPINPITGQQFYYYPLKDGQINKGFMLCPAPGLSDSYCIKKWEMYEVY